MSCWLSVVVVWYIFRVEIWVSCLRHRRNCNKKLKQQRRVSICVCIFTIFTSTIWGHCHSCVRAHSSKLRLFFLMDHYAVNFFFKRYVFHDILRSHLYFRKLVKFQSRYFQTPWYFKDVVYNMDLLSLQPESTNPCYYIGSWAQNADLTNIDVDLIGTLMTCLSHNFAHATTAQLSWHVQNYGSKRIISIWIRQYNNFIWFRLLCSWNVSERIPLLSPVTLSTWPIPEVFTSRFYKGWRVMPCPRGCSIYLLVEGITWKPLPQITEPLCGKSTACQVDSLHRVIRLNINVTLTKFPSLAAKEVVKIATLGWSQWRNCRQYDDISISVFDYQIRWQSSLCYAPNSQLTERVQTGR